MMTHFIDWWRSLVQVWAREMKLAYRDKGVLIFFLLLCAVYPLLYSLIYNTEVERDMRVVAIDDCRTQLSRQLIRNIDATPEVKIIGYAANLAEAQELLHTKQCYGIVYVPREFSGNVARRTGAHVVLYSDMSLMIRYKNLLMAVTNVTQEMAFESMGKAIAPVIYNTGSIVESRQVPIGNTGMGIASAILLFVLPLVLQQSMILGIGMLHGGSIERRRKNGGVDPEAIDASVSATILGKMLCHLTFYVIPTMYVLYFTPTFFDFPQNSDLIEIMLLSIPYLIGVSLMGQVLQLFVNERESVFLLFAFTSVLFIFLSGASWPRFAMSPLWQAAGDCLPCTWMSNAYVAMQSTDASLSQVARSLLMMWVVAGIMFVLAYILERFVSRPRYRTWQRNAAADPNALQRYDIVKNGVL